jgi:hypothetical protein
VNWRLAELPGGDDPDHGFLGGWDGLEVVYESAELVSQAKGLTRPSGGGAGQAVDLVGAMDDRHGQAPPQHARGYRPKG